MLKSDKVHTNMDNEELNHVINWIDFKKNSNDT